MGDRREEHIAGSCRVICRTKLPDQAQAFGDGLLKRGAGMGASPMAGGHRHVQVGGDIPKGMPFDKITLQDLERVRRQATAADQDAEILQGTLDDAYSPGPIHGGLLRSGDACPKLVDARDVIAIRSVRFRCSALPASVVP